MSPRPYPHPPVRVWVPLERLVVEVVVALSAEVTWLFLVDYAARARGWDEVGLCLLAGVMAVMGAFALFQHHRYNYAATTDA